MVRKKDICLWGSFVNRSHLRRKGRERRFYFCSEIVCLGILEVFVITGEWFQHTVLVRSLSVFWLHRYFLKGYTAISKIQAWHRGLFDGVPRWQRVHFPPGFPAVHSRLSPPPSFRLDYSFSNNHFYVLEFSVICRSLARYHPFDFGMSLVYLILVILLLSM